MFDRTNNTFPKANKVKFERHLYSRVRRSYLSLIILIYFKMHTKNPYLNTGLISLFIIIYDICVDVIAYFYIQHLSITSYHFDMYLDIIACILADASTLKMFDKHDLSWDVLTHNKQIATSIYDGCYANATHVSSAKIHAGIHETWHGRCILYVIIITTFTNVQVERECLFGNKIFSENDLFTYFQLSSETQIY